jgi:hypothetical protein
MAQGFGDGFEHREFTAELHGDSIFSRRYDHSFGFLRRPARCVWVHRTCGVPLGVRSASPRFSGLLARLYCPLRVRDFPGEPS